MNKQLQRLIRTVQLWITLQLFDGMSPFWIWSTSMCLCMSPKLSNSFPHDLHLRNFPRFSCALFDKLNFSHPYSRYSVTYRW